MAPADGTPQILGGFLVLVLLTLPGVVGEVPWVADINATAVRMEGEVDADAGFVGLRFRHASEGNAGSVLGSDNTDLPLPSPLFRLEALEAVLETLHEESVVFVDPLARQRVTEPYVTNEHLTNLTVQGVEVREEYYFTVVADQANIRIESGCLISDFSDSEPEQQDPQGNLVIDRAIQVQLCGGPAELEVRGRFSLILWEWDADLESDQREGDVTSGLDRDDGITMEGPTGDVAFGSGDRRIQTFHISDGLLSIPAYDPPGLNYLYVDQLQADLLGSATFLDAVGRLADGTDSRPLDADSLKLSGELGLELMMPPPDGSSSHLSAGVSGELVRATADREVLAWAQEHVDSDRLAGWPWLLVGGIFLPAGAWFAFDRSRRPHRETSASQRRGRHYFSLAQSHQIQGNSRLALKWCRKAIRKDSMVPDYHALKAKCHAMGGDFEAALASYRQSHELIPYSDPDTKAWNAFEAACAAGRRGWKEEAMAWLGIALRLDPTIQQEAADEPDLSCIYFSGSPRSRPRRTTTA